MTQDIFIPNVDIEILKIQHQDLIEKLWQEPDSVLWGLVEMLDYIIDEYDLGIDKEYQQLIDYKHNDKE